MVTETSTVHIGTALGEAIEDLRLSQDVRDLAGASSWRGAALALGLSLDCVRMLGADASRCQRATKTHARARLAELAAATKGAA